MLRLKQNNFQALLDLVQFEANVFPTVQYAVLWIFMTDVLMLFVRKKYPENLQLNLVDG